VRPGARGERRVRAAERVHLRARRPSGAAPAGVGGVVVGSEDLDEVVL
jgi:hypothetical protein